MARSEMEVMLAREFLEEGERIHATEAMLIAMLRAADKEGVERTLSLSQLLTGVRKIRARREAVK